MQCQPNVGTTKASNLMCMGPELTEDDIAHLCMFMRVIDVLTDSPDILAENAEIRKHYEELRVRFDALFGLLTDEQRDMVLEQHRLQLIEIQKREKRNKARREKRKAAKEQAKNNKED